MARTNAAIFFHTEGYTTGGAKLMGRQAAGEGFLRAWMRHARVDALLCHAARKTDAEAFVKLRDAHAGRRIPVKWIAQGDAAALAAAGTLYLPDPRLAEQSWRRRRMGAAARYSLCGITHTTASHTAMDNVAGVLSAPVEPWDALVCTSRVVLDSVRRLLDAEARWLAERLRAVAPPPPELALIPLGVDCAAYAPDAARRAAWRARLGVGAGEVAFLFVGRLSYHAKANPAPMYAALEQAARAGRGVHLIQAGWFQNDAIRRTFEAGARALCPSVKMHFLDGRDAAVRADVRQAADVFISLPDNVQETFGLTPAEAMAAGLPCIVSDWDGYRETVRDGVDGVRVPTLAPPPGAGAALAARHEDGVESYDRYIGYSALAVSVDPAATAQACAALAADPALRQRMGEAARRRALEEFDWQVILRRYQALWQSLAERRAAAPAAAAAEASPRRRDPFWLFAEYPTRTLSGADRLLPVAGAGREQLRTAYASGLLGYGAVVLPEEKTLADVLARIGAEPGLPVEHLLRELGGADPARLQRGIVWLHKAGLVTLK